MYFEYHTIYHENSYRTDFKFSSFIHLLQPEFIYILFIRILYFFVVVWGYVMSKDIIFRISMTEDFFHVHIA